MGNSDYKIENNIGLIKWKSKQWADKQPLLTYDDIFSYACESYIKAERKADKTLPKKAVISYLCKSMDRAISHAIKKEGKLNQYKYIDINIDTYEDFHSDEDIHIKETVAKIFSFLNDEEADILKRHYLQGETLVSIAKEKKCNQMAMTRRLSAIREKILENVILE